MSGARLWENVEDDVEPPGLPQKERGHIAPTTIPHEEEQMEFGVCCYTLLYLRPSRVFSSHQGTGLYVGPPATQVTIQQLETRTSTLLFSVSTPPITQYIIC